MRIIAGTYKGRRLAASDHLRPTGDRVREALFSILGGMLEGAVFVDAYAGTGAVGLEALSRGAHAVLVEKDPASVRLLRQNLDLLDIQGGVTVVEDDALRFLKNPAASRRVEAKAVDVVFCDPPYDYGPREKLLRTLAASPLVGPDTTVVVEARRGTRLRSPDGLTLMREERYGETELLFYRRSGAPAEAPSP
jgi:16S rRNA (guanine966-N2)-methyltransferase